MGLTTITLYAQFCENAQSGRLYKRAGEVFDSEQERLIEDKLATKNDLIKLESNLQRDMRELEYRVIIKLADLMAVSIAVVATLVKLL